MNLGTRPWRHLVLLFALIGNFTLASASQPLFSLADIGLYTLSWSPDSGRLAFGMYQDENWDVFLINRDGTGLTIEPHINS